MNDLNFIKKMSEYESEVAAKISEKNDAINKLRQKVTDKEKGIDAKQAEYTKKPSDALFQELLTLKRDLVTLKINVTSADEIITIPPVKTVPQDEIVKEVEDYIEGLGLDKLKSDILTAKQNFLKGIDEFDAQVKKIIALKIEIGDLGLDKSVILRTLEKYKGSYACNEEITLSQRDIDLKRVGIAIQAAGIYSKY
jgi:hypothetical protein